MKLSRTLGPNCEEASCSDSMVIEKIQLATVIIELAMTDKIAQAASGPNVYSKPKSLTLPIPSQVSNSISRNDSPIATVHIMTGTNQKLEFRRPQNAETRIRENGVAMLCFFRLIVFQGHFGLISVG
tara:strand:+ start:233 stop:613 length:381 start_codon:yes stop_codon:yes gene_type:complete